jgi:hypothetical protein
MWHVLAVNREQHGERRPRPTIATSSGGATDRGSVRASEDDLIDGLNIGHLERRAADFLPSPTAVQADR